MDTQQCKRERDTLASIFHISADSDLELDTVVVISRQYTAPENITVDHENRTVTAEVHNSFSTNFEIELGKIENGITTLTIN